MKVGIGSVAIHALTGLVGAGATGCVIKYITKQTLQAYNKRVKNESQLSAQRIKEISNLTSQCFAALVGIGVFLNNILMQQYGDSDRMPYEDYQKLLDSEFKERLYRLLPQVFPQLLLPRT